MILWEPGQVLDWNVCRHSCREREQNGKERRKVEEVALVLVSHGQREEWRGFRSRKRVEKSTGLGNRQGFAFS